MRYLLLFIVFFSLPVVYGFTSTKNNLPDYSELVVQGRISVILQEGTEFTEETKSSLSNEELEKLSFTKKGNQMIIKYSGVNFKELDITITLTIPTLEVIESKQGARISMDSKMRIKAPKISLSVFAGGIITGKFDVEAADVRIDQGGDMFLVGTAKQFICNVTTGGSIDAINFIASNCVAKVKMGGNITVQTKETLNATVFSGGTIRYKGNGVVTETIKLGGTIQKMN
jgi:hypothetical protein